MTVTEDRDVAAGRARARSRDRSRAPTSAAVSPCGTGCVHTVQPGPRPGSRPSCDPRSRRSPTRRGLRTPRSGRPTPRGARFRCERRSGLTSTSANVAARERRRERGGTGASRVGEVEIGATRVTTGVRSTRSHRAGRARPRRVVSSVVHRWNVHFPAARGNDDVCASSVAAARHASTTSGSTLRIAPNGWPGSQFQSYFWL